MSDLPLTADGFARSEQLKFLVNYDKLAWFFLSSALVFFCLDFSGDYCLVSIHPEIQEILEPFSIFLRTSGSVMILCLSSLGLLRFFSRKEARISNRGVVIFLSIFFLIHLIWGSIALARDVPIEFIVGDTRHLFVYFGVFAFSKWKKDFHLKNLTYLLSCLVILLFTKLLLSLIFDLLGDGFSYRYLVKACNVFLFTSFFFIALQFSKKSRFFIAMTAMAGLGVVASNMRGYFVGFFCGLIFFLFGFLKIGGLKKYLSKRSLGPIIKMAAFLMLIPTAYLVVAAFTYLPNQELWFDGIEYRLMQINNLYLRFIDSPWMGWGFGSFDTLYEGYRDWNARPYLIELEYLNLLTKLGIFGASIFLGCFVLIFFLVFSCAKKVQRFEDKLVLLGMGTGLFALMVASTTNVLYSSLTFHIFCMLTLLFMKILTNSQKEASL